MQTSMQWRVELRVGISTGRTLGRPLGLPILSVLECWNGTWGENRGRSKVPEQTAGCGSGCLEFLQDFGSAGLGRSLSRRIGLGTPGGGWSKSLLTVAGGGDLVPAL